jgi:hypothetical protein
MRGARASIALVVLSMNVAPTLAHPTAEPASLDSMVQSASTDLSEYLNSGKWRLKDVRYPMPGHIAFLGVVTGIERPGTYGGEFYCRDYDLVRFRVLKALHGHPVDSVTVCTGNVILFDGLGRPEFIREFPRPLWFCLNDTALVIGRRYRPVPQPDALGVEFIRFVRELRNGRCVLAVPTRASAHRIFEQAEAGADLSLAEWYGLMDRTMVTKECRLQDTEDAIRVRLGGLPKKTRR